MEIAMALYQMAIVSGIALIIAWTVLPFAVIGTKPLLRKLIADIQVTNALLERQVSGELRIDAGDRRLPKQLRIRRKLTFSKAEEIVSKRP
jgi:hypothetical protein